MDLQFESSVVLVTGGTGDIGRAVVSGFLDEGARVAFTYHKASDRAREIVNEHGEDRCRGYQASFEAGDELRQIVSQIADDFGRIDILVNNAAMADILPFPMIDYADLDFCLKVNIGGSFIITQECVRHMIRRRSGAIINMGSLSAERIMETPVHYATSKAALTGFTYSLARELKNYRIRVNCVSPGLIEGGLGDLVQERQRQQYCEFSTVGRPGKTEEVANLILFLASEKAAFINGQVFHIDGGI